ncbi:hypothetical protein C7212DRAFT_361655 [Tuber magnatum]|uniref:Uncharacterized protein n=1 Tax=Tuber magnatum TaxID=42249 RepID=A0A317SW29_9PEZI|nr:hypothetical protein C7212DRAFT_361655 [Tuber magnatum]
MSARFQKALEHSAAISTIIVGTLLFAMDLLHRSDAQGINKKLDKVQTDLNDTNHQVRALETKIGTVETKIGTVETKLGTVETKLGTVEAHLTKEIRLARAISENAPLLLIDDLKKRQAAAEVLDKYKKCIQSGGTDCL